ncbi:MAG: hypothetical protein D6772_06820, partial [Bacteroidetes bacterium]
MAIGITPELSFSDRLRIELNNLFLGLALPFALFYLVYVTVGLRLTISYVITIGWIIILLIPLLLNHFKKYTAAKVYSIIVPLMGIVLVHLLHGWAMRLEPTYLHQVLLCFFFFQRRTAIIMCTLVLLTFAVVSLILLTFTPPFADRIIPVVPFVYFIFSVISSIIL